MQNVSRSGEKGGPPAFGWWWKVECCMLGYRKACCCTFDSYSALKQTIRPQEWLCHSRLRMVQSLQIAGMKQNVLFLQRASMRKLIKGKHEKRCSFLERKGEWRQGLVVIGCKSIELWNLWFPYYWQPGLCWLVVESRMLYVNPWDMLLITFL